MYGPDLYGASVNYSGYCLCDEHMYKPYMECRKPFRLFFVCMTTNVGLTQLTPISEIGIQKKGHFDASLQVIMTL